MTSIDLDGKTVYVHGGIPGEDGARWTVSYRMLQAHIHVAHAAIARTAWADEYFHCRASLVARDGSGDTLARWKALSRCITSPCLELLETLAPSDKATPPTLADYCLAATVSVRVLGGGGRGVRAELVSGPHPQSACSISPMPTRALHYLPATLPRFPASEMLVESEEINALRPSLPHRVRTVGGGGDDDDDTGRSAPLFFKPCLADRETEFAREVDTLARIEGAQLHINTTRMAGVVTTEDGTAVLGVLLPWIDGAAPLAAETAVARVDIHGKWKEEVQGVVGALHEHGIVWGDVNPHNIVIDDHCAAWVVDFGGECNPEFVDEENRESATGDWQGLHRVFDCWLPARAAASSSSGR